MLTVGMKRVIRDSLSAQLTDVYYELLKVNSLRLSQELRVDQLAVEMIDEVITEVSTRSIADDRTTYIEPSLYPPGPRLVAKRKGGPVR